jgi:hypothetical protein
VKVRIRIFFLFYFPFFSKSQKMLLLLDECTLDVSTNQGSGLVEFVSNLVHKKDSSSTAWPVAAQQVCISELCRKLVEQYGIHPMNNISPVSISDTQVLEVFWADIRNCQQSLSSIYSALATAFSVAKVEFGDDEEDDSAIDEIQRLLCSHMEQAKGMVCRHAIFADYVLRLKQARTVDEVFRLDSFFGQIIDYTTATGRP